MQEQHRFLIVQMESIYLGPFDSDMIMVEYEDILGKDNGNDSNSSEIIVQQPNVVPLNIKNNQRKK
ncbi:MAG: hypothetical protein ACP5M9_01555 [Candidatus Micrarchaeia archaeon]